MLQRLLRAFGGNNYVYYFDLSFDETLRRHNLKPNKDEYGEKAMRGW
jgi:hypothetical protein